MSHDASAAPRRGGIRPSSRGWAVVATAAALLLVGGLTSYPGGIGFGLALAAVVACAAGGLALPAPVRVIRDARPPRVTRRSECSAAMTITNTSTWLSVDAMGEDLVAGRPVPFDIPRLRPGESVTAEVEIPTHRRGTVDFGPLVLARSSLGDLLRSRRSYGSYTSVLVEPRVLDALGLPPGMRRGHIGADERIAHGGTDLVGMREYLAGDDLRRVHWSTSARRGTLMVREDADPSAPHLTVLLDDRLASYGQGAEAIAGLDEAVDVAASLLATAAQVASPAAIRAISGSLDAECDPDPTGGGALPPGLLGTLATLPGHATPLTYGAGALQGSPDVLAVVTGAHADLPALLLDASAAPAGILLIVDAQPPALVSAQQAVTVLRGPRAEDLIHGWRSAVVQ